MLDHASRAVLGTRATCRCRTCRCMSAVPFFTACPLLRGSSLPAARRVAYCGSSCDAFASPVCAKVDDAPGRSLGYGIKSLILLMLSRFEEPLRHHLQLERRVDLHLLHEFPSRSRTGWVCSCFSWPLLAREPGPGSPQRRVISFCPSWPGGLISFFSECDRHSLLQMFYLDGSSPTAEQQNGPSAGVQAFPPLVPKTWRDGNFQRDCLRRAELGGRVLAVPCSKHPSSACLHTLITPACLSG